jgi:hypothetical protein
MEQCVNLGGVACRFLWACFITIKNITPRTLRRLHLLAVKSLRPIIFKGHLMSAVHLGGRRPGIKYTIISSIALNSTFKSLNLIFFLFQCIFFVAFALRMIDTAKNFSQLV